MTIFADPSELRLGTRLPAALVEACTPLPQLEARTGADLLISPVRAPVTTDHLLRQHAQAGMLVQRKSGTDFTASITDGRLFHSLAKMLEWTELPWLVLTGAIENRNGQAFVDGWATLPYMAVIGALDKWQARGGYITWLSSDNDLVAWVGGRLDFLRSIQDQPTKRLYQQRIIEADRVRQVLAMFPGLGPVRVDALLDKMADTGSDVTLVQALCWLTDYATDLSGTGIGEGTRRAVRQFCGLQESEDEIGKLYEYFGSYFSVHGS